MVSTAPDREAIIDALLTDIRERRRVIRRFAYVRMLWSALAWLFAVLGALYVARFSGPLAFGVFLAASFLHFYFIFRLLPLVEEALCHRSGFVCPYCGEPLAPRSAHAEDLLERGECPSCFQRIEAPFPQPSNQAMERTADRGARDF